ncbi:helix-turn-helix transcriptional regulator [Streptomyces sp. RFCAC02]|uniref:helix-turn-helix domain-containing protein n=1 Tax=Streptomyces sp. RFCAC02 TaxID=2499143 RepID=UPI00143DC3D9|nr:helix-turn-helix transcriptional regulator [Streptomyces sp. RFCAC02]
MTGGRVGGGATVLRVVLGKRLRDLREAAGVSFDEAAIALDVTHGTVRRIEKAQVGLKIPYVEKLLRSYGVTAQEDIDAFLALVREANRPGWWHGYRDVLPDWLGTFLSLESEASQIRAYEPYCVPALLQTEAYAAAVLRAAHPQVPAARLERLVALRLARQDVLTGPHPPQVWLVAEETVLRRPVAPRAVLRAQLARLVEAVGQPSVRLQIMPFAAGAHPGMYGPFHLFRFPVAELPDVACSETVTGGTFHETPGEVSAFREALDRVCAQAAPPRRTEAVLAGLRKEL